MLDWTDCDVDTGDVRIAVRDYGGTGPDVLLIPGGGRTLADWNLVVPILAQSNHVVAIDVRGHGLSGDAPWVWREILTDLEAVVGALSLVQPSVVGHSLGGMIAAMWGDVHADCPAVINLGGHGLGTPEQYDGFPPALVVKRFAELRAAMEAAVAAGLPLVPQPDVEHLVATGVPRDMAEDLLARTHEIRDSVLHTRHGNDVLLAMTTAVEDLPVMDLWEKCACPLLIVQTVAGDSEVGGPSWMPALLAAYRRGLTRDLAALANPLVTVRTFDGDHQLLLNSPSAAAETICGFLDSCQASES